jgi:cytochrome c biogenesis protein ResB
MARLAERALRIIGDARAGLPLLLLVAGANVVAALLPGARGLLEGWPYATLLGLTALSGLATVAVRTPAAWREWRHPGPVSARGALEATLPARDREEVEGHLRGAGYRVRVEASRGGWAVHGVRRGWSRLAGIVSHLAIVVVVLGVAIGAAFGSETTFSLLPGEQALLDAPRAGFSSAVRLEGLDAAFADDGRPRRLDTEVTFLRDGAVVRSTVLRVNEPGDLDGYLVHPWTYGPAARLRVTTLGGSALLDDAIPLDAERDGAPVGSAELATAGLTLGLVLVDADANRLGISAVAADGLVDTAQLVPGEAVRVGDVVVELRGFDAWVTFLSRRDPGLAVLFAGAGLLSASLAVAFWLPRRRVTVRSSRAGAGLQVALRGERFDRADDELRRLERVVARR